MTRKRFAECRLLAVICFAGLAVALGDDPKPGTVHLAGFQKGLTLGGAHWRKEEYGNLDWTLDQAKAYGASHILVIPNGFLYPGESGHEIRKVTFDDPLYDTDPRFQTQEWGWWGASLNDAQIREIAAGVQARGMKLVLKPHIDPWDGTSRGAATPSDPKAFFANYTKFIVHYATLAEELGADLFVIGTELSDISSTRGALAKTGVNVTGAWRKIIADVRKAYQGPLTYSSSAFGDWKTWNPKDIGQGPSRIGFWEDLDFIGFEPYFGVTEKSNPTVEELTEEFQRKMDLYAKPLAEKYGKKILLTEVNAYAFDSMNTDPIGMFTTPEDHPIDHQEQADYYEALFLTVSQRSYLEGTYIWPFYLKPDFIKTEADYAEMQRKSHRDSLLGVPAGAVLKKWYQAIDES